MNRTEAELERRISQVFDHGEILSRQLRLTAQEADWAAEHYPVLLTPLGEGWYDMEFQGAYCG